MPSWSENSSTWAHTVYKCRDRLTTRKYNAHNHINNMGRGIVTGKLTEMVRGGCCCEAVVGVVLLDESAVEAAVDMGTGPTLIC